MPVPPWPQFVEPVLRVLSEANGPMPRKTLVSTVVERMNLSPEELAEMAGSTTLCSMAGRITSQALLEKTILVVNRGDTRPEYAETAREFVQELKGKQRKRETKA